MKRWTYWAALAAALFAALLAGWTPLGESLDNLLYDARQRSAPASFGSSIVLAIDEAALASGGGMGGLRGLLTEALERLARAQARVVAIDVILADAQNAEQDARLAGAMKLVPQLILAADIRSDASAWDWPLPLFRESAAALGHVHADPDPVLRRVPLEKASEGRRLWAVALEARRLETGARAIVESPHDLSLAGDTIAAERLTARALRVRWDLAAPQVLRIDDLRREPAKFRDRVVFIGVTALSAARDRIMTARGLTEPGVSVHAQLFETLRAPASLLREAPLSLGLLIAAGFVLAAGLLFQFVRGWPAYALAALLLAGVHLLASAAYSRGIVLPYGGLLFPAVFGLATAAAWQFLATRRQLAATEADRSRYQQAIRFVTHEMKTPLATIQGSSEILSRYNLPEEKRRQILETVNSESKRLARLVQTFLDVEKLSEGQLELKREPFEPAAAVAACLIRIQPLAERKRIELAPEPLPEITLTGDRELLEYAVYNLLSNAVKYSPANTRVAVRGAIRHNDFRLSVVDQGMGIEEKDLARLFTKFYRTERAQASGIEGTGLGLSLVEQIVTGHGGRMEVESRIGQGSSFTMVLPCPKT